MEDMRHRKEEHDKAHCNNEHEQEYTNIIYNTLQ